MRACDHSKNVGCQAANIGHLNRRRSKLRRPLLTLASNRMPESASRNCLGRAASRGPAATIGRHRRHAALRSWHGRMPRSPSPLFITRHIFIEMSTQFRAPVIILLMPESLHAMPESPLSPTARFAQLSAYLPYRRRHRHQLRCASIRTR